jgi:hypothetical protein
MRWPSFSIRSLMLMVALLGGSVMCASPASAGAPNWECRISDYTMALDQHADTAIVRRKGKVSQVKLKTTYQNGYETDQTLTLGKTTWVLQIREMAVVATAGKQKLQGKCAQIIGSQGPKVLDRLTPMYRKSSLVSDVVKELPAGTIVWHVVRETNKKDSRYEWAPATFVTTDMSKFTGFLALPLQ